jgi:cytochrome c-type biogenesis protein
MDQLFGLLGRITNLLQPLLQQGELSFAMLSMVTVAGLVAGITPFGLGMAVLVAGRVGGAADAAVASSPAAMSRARRAADGLGRSRRAVAGRAGGLPDVPDADGEPAVGRVGYVAAGPDASSRAVRQALWFSLGSATSLFAAGLVAAAAGSILLDYRLARYIPLLTLFMGVQLVVGRRWQLLSRLRLRPDLPSVPRTAGRADAFLLGLPFGVITAPCTAPIIVAVLSLIAANGGLVFGLLVLLAFTIGRSVPLVLVSRYGHRAVARLAGRKSSVALRRALGSVLVLASAYFLSVGGRYLGA